MKILKFLLLGLLVSATFVALAQDSWSVESYPDESGFQQRIDGMFLRIAKLPFGEKSKSKSYCPDTGLAVYSYALEGETIYSPFTGTAFSQVSTGYFGPKERDSSGNIVRFGGDALKKDLPPATAALLLDTANISLKGFLGIAGNLNQQYHFAAKNWARFYPLLAERMGEEWKRNFHQAVGQYQELGRPSDGYRTYDPLSVAHNLIGEPGELLGGNTKDGGTENHKIMWRSSALVYAQNFPDGTSISGYGLGEAKNLLQGYFESFLETVLTKGNGEYDSQIYYPHSIESLLNLYDYSPDPKIKEVAKGLLDYFLATYAVKVYDGAIGGAQKRGSNTVNSQGEMFNHLHAWFGNEFLKDSEYISSLHQITSSYRPNQLILDLYHKHLETPFEMEIARPDYHSINRNSFHEYFYASKSFGLGSVYMNQVDNPNQQVVWSLVVKGDKGPLTFGGSQPFHKAPGGHSPYTQTLQKEGVILVASAPTVVGEKDGLPFNKYRLEWANANLIHLDEPAMQGESLDGFFEQASLQAATWLFVPKEVNAVQETNGKIFLSVNNTFLTIVPFNSDYYWLKKPSNLAIKSKAIQGLLETYDILVVPGEFSGYALEVNEADSFGDFQAYNKAALRQQLDINIDSRTANFESLSGINLKLKYMGNQLKAEGIINGTHLDFEEWADRGVYKSPVLTVKDSVMEIRNEKIGYQMLFKDGEIIYNEIEIK